MDISNLVNMRPIETLHIIEYPNGRFGYVGKVPASIGYIDPTPEKLAAMKFGGRFGPRTRTFATHKDALSYAQERGFIVE